VEVTRDTRVTPGVLLKKVMICMKAIFGRKLGMTQMFDEEGKVIPITILEVLPATVVQEKHKEKDGYEAVQVGMETLKKEKKSQKGKPFRLLREVRGKAEEELPHKGDALDVSLFEEGDEVEVAGISKGKGFQGAVKRWGFSGRNASHGVKHEHRTLGSVGSQFPQRVIKGRKMPGHMGAARVTVRNLKVVKIDSESQSIALRGAVPGSRGTLVEIRGI